MITTTLATWLLVVQLQNPNQPQEERIWNMRYSNNTAEQCEERAKRIWGKYNDRYSSTMTPWMQEFTTTCHATTAHHNYIWFIKCDQYDNCETKKLKELKR